MVIKFAVEENDIFNEGRWDREGSPAKGRDFLKMCFKKNQTTFTNQYVSIRKFSTSSNKQLSFVNKVKEIPKFFRK